MYKYNLGISFEEIVEKHPDNVALIFSRGHAVSYKELNRKANQIGRYLLDIGVRKGDVVCLSGEKRVSTFACMLACLKIGAIYVILDPDSPIERLRRIVMTCLPKILFVRSEFGQRMSGVSGELEVEVVNNESGESEDRFGVFDDTNLEETRVITGSNPAYIMYTSGSTGFPKGAVMTHSNVLNFIDWSIEAFNITSEDVLTNVNPLYFDNSVFDFYSSLFSGACMIPFDKETVTNPKTLISLIDELECTLWFSVPTLLIYLQTMKALSQSNMKRINRFIFGGEGYPKAKLKQLYDTYCHRAELFNVYGPTECTCICSSYKIRPEDFDNLHGLPPLGKMINNFSYVILDGEDRAVADGDVGELCLLGPNVGKGYYNDAERTQVNFVQNPLNKKYDEIMYRTGDLVRYNPNDDKIYVMGRKDNQIKHMGYRIELEEIETALSCLDYVSQAVALHENMDGLSRIVAVVSSGDNVNEKRLRKDLGEIIPSYMIPTKWHVVKHLPRTPNGKIDRRRLIEKYVGLGAE